MGRDRGGDVVDEGTFKAIGRRFTETQGGWNVDRIFEAAAKNQPELNRIGRDIAGAIEGVTWHEAPAKTKARFLQKVEEKGTAPGAITDVVRGTLSAMTPTQADAAVDALKRHYTILDEDWRRYPGGYVDRKVNIRFDDGQVGEVIIASNHMIAVKNEAHVLLERSRGMEGEARDRQRLKDLNEQETAYFGPAKVKDNGPWEKTYTARASEVGRGGVAPKVFEKPSSVRTAPDAAALSKADADISDQSASPSLSANARSASPSRTNATGVPSQLSQVTDIVGGPSESNVGGSRAANNDRWATDDAQIATRADVEIKESVDKTAEEFAEDAALYDANLASMRERGLVSEADEAAILAAEEAAVNLEQRALAYEAAAACEMEG